MDRQKISSAISEKLNFEISETDIRELAYQLWLDDQQLFESTGYHAIESSEDKFYWNLAETRLKEAKKQQITSEIMDRILNPVISEHSGLIQDETREYIQNVTRVLRQELIQSEHFVLPDGTRFHKRVGTHDCLIIEQQPMMRTVSVDTRYHNGKIGAHSYDQLGHNPGYSAKGGPKQYRIALPYVVYCINLINGNFQDMYITFRNTPIKSLDDDLGLCILPNTQASGRVCCPMPESNNGNKTIVEIVNPIIGQYWQTQFRYSLHGVLPNHPAMKTFEDWEKASLENPLFVLDVKWTTMTHNFSRLVAEIVAREEDEVKLPRSLSNLSAEFMGKAAQILSLKKKKD